jgi:hypothetical protein
MTKKEIIEEYLCHIQSENSFIPETERQAIKKANVIIVIKGGVAYLGYKNKNIKVKIVDLD